jgi:hypothetical protein
MFGEESNDLFELRNVTNSSRDHVYQRLTAILRSSTELMCLNASIAAAYFHAITE